MTKQPQYPPPGPKPQAPPPPPPKKRMVKCPGCGHELPEEDVHAQIAHMESRHPDIIADRLRREGL